MNKGWTRSRVPREQWQTYDRERDGAGRGRMTVSGVRVGDSMGTDGDEEGARGCGVALTIEAAASVSKG